MMHHHSPLMRVVKHASWLLCGIAAVAWGLIALGGYMNKSWNIWEFDFFASNPQLVMVLQLLIGVAGVLSLLSWFLCLGHCDDKK